MNSLSNGTVLNKITQWLNYQTQCCVFCISVSSIVNTYDNTNWMSQNLSFRTLQWWHFCSIYNMQPCSQTYFPSILAASLEVSSISVVFLSLRTRWTRTGVSSPSRARKPYTWQHSSVSNSLINLALCAKIEIKSWYSPYQAPVPFISVTVLTYWEFDCTSSWHLSADNFQFFSSLT